MNTLKSQIYWVSNNYFLKHKLLSAKIEVDLWAGFCIYRRLIKVFSCRKQWSASKHVISWCWCKALSVTVSFLTSFLPSFPISLLTFSCSCCYTSTELHCCIIPSCLSPGNDSGWALQEQPCSSCARGWAAHTWCWSLADGLLNLLFKRHSCFRWELWTRVCQLKAVHLPVLAWRHIFTSSFQCHQWMLAVISHFSLFGNE